MENSEANLTAFDLKRVKPNLSSAAENQVKPLYQSFVPIHPAYHQEAQEITEVSEGKMKGDTREHCMVAAVWVFVHMCTGEIKDIMGG